MATFDEIYRKIREYSTIIVHRHTKPDPDAIGSQAGLSRSIKLAFPDKKVLCAGESVGDLDWINTMDDVKDSDYQGALVIVVDTVNIATISDQRYNLGDLIIKIDHHPDVDQYARMSYVDKPAAAEIIFDFLKAENLPITKDVAAAIYAGIVGDTGRFLYNNTNEHTFIVAAELKRIGIDITEIAQTIDNVTLSQAKLQNHIIELMKIDPCGAACVIITQNQLQKLGITTEQVEITIPIPGRVKEVIAWVSFDENHDGTYNVHYRSKGPIINKLAAKHQGSGGHAFASGAKAENLVEVQQIFKELVEVTKKYEKNNS